jgi:hypothetical protein
MKDDDDYDYDDYDELSPTLAAQLAKLEHSHPIRSRSQESRHVRGTRLRRQLEDWQDSRRMRNEIDYLR